MKRELPKGGADGGMSDGVGLFTWIIGGIQVETMVNFSRGACVIRDVNGTMDSINLKCLETKKFRG